MKAKAIIDNLKIKKNTNKYNFFKIKEIREIIDHIDNIKLVMLLSTLLILIVTIAFDLYFIAIALELVVIMAYIGLNLYQLVMDRKIYPLIKY